MAVTYDSVMDVPAEVWLRHGTDFVLESREWMGLPRWPGDDYHFLVEDSTMIPFRINEASAPWRGMNLIDICSGEGLPLSDADGLVESARRSTGRHLMVGTPGYYTVPIGRCDPPALNCLIRAVEGYASTHGLHWGFAHLPAGRGDLLRELRGRGYETGVTSAGAMMTLPGTGFDAYLASLQPGYRKSVHREENRFRKNNYSIEMATGRAGIGWLADIGDLEAELNRSHGFDASPQFFVQQNIEYLHAFGERMVFIKAEHEGEPAASVTLFAGDSDMVVRSFGIRNTETTRHAFVYFNVVYYQVIKLAYLLGITRIWYGTSALQVKTARGAKLVELYSALPASAPQALLDLLHSCDARARKMLGEYGRSEKVI